MHNTGTVNQAIFSEAVQQVCRTRSTCVAHWQHIMYSAGHMEHVLAYTTMASNFHCLYRHALAPISE